MMARARESRTRPAGIREIAHALNVSIGTVDRALHGRPGINPSTRRKILDKAKAMAYRPNLAARLLSSRRRVRIGVNLPGHLAAFWDEMRDGIRDAAYSLVPEGADVVYRSYPLMVKGEREALADALEDDIDGLILAPGAPSAVAPLLRKAVAGGLPVVFANTEAPQIKTLSSVSIDQTVSGALVAELLGRFLGGVGQVLLVTGQSTTVDHARKIAGFRKTAARLWPRLKVAGVIEAHDDEAEAYDVCRAVFARDRRITGVYVTTANSPPVIRAIEDAGVARRLTVVATDVIPAMRPMIQKGQVVATIDQRPSLQGALAFESLYRFLVERVEPPRRIRLAPHVVMRSNLRALRDR